MESKLLKPIKSINSLYSTITFAVSNPDSTIINIPTKERTALFRKEVTIWKWIDKSASVQCLQCHALGHIKSSKVCPLVKNSVKCYICKVAQKFNNHGSKCPCKHVAAGTCNRKSYRCLNCQQLGHHCRHPSCPACECCHPWHPQKAWKNKNKNKGKDMKTTKEVKLHCLHGFCTR